MKHNVSKLIALCLAIAMIATLSACNQTTTNEPTEKPTTAVQETAKDDAPVVTEDPYALPTLPLEEPVTLTVLAIERVGYDQECIVSKKLEELTGVILDNTWVPGADFGTKQNISLTAGIKHDITVITNAPNKSTKELATEMGEQGMIVNIKDYMHNMPNLTALDESCASWRPQVEDSKGNIYMYVTPQTVLGSYDGVMVYYVWNVSEEALNALELDDPATIDELTVTLRALKEAYPDSYPLLTLGNMGTTFGVGGNSSSLFWNPTTDQYEIGALNDGYREMITYEHQLYEEGLLDPEYATMSSDQLNDKLINNKGFMYWGFTGDTFVIGDSAVAVNPNFGLHSIDQLSYKGNTGKYDTSGGGGVMNTAWVAIVDATSENKEVALAYLDYELSEECVTMLSWGIEGETYEIVDGQARFLSTLQRKANPNGTVDIKDYLSTSNYGTGVLPTVEFYASVSTGWDQKSTEKMMYFTANADTLCQKLPNFSISLAPDESDSASNIKTQLNTYLEESLIKFVTGDIAITDEEWDTFTSTIESLGAQELLDIYNSRLAQTPRW